MAPECPWGLWCPSGHLAGDTGAAMLAGTQHTTPAPRRPAPCPLRVNFENNTLIFHCDSEQGMGLDSLRMTKPKVFGFLAHCSSAHGARCVNCCYAITHEALPAICGPMSFFFFSKLFALSQGIKSWPWAGFTSVP